MSSSTVAIRVYLAAGRASADQTRRAVLALSEIPGPAYLRIGSGCDPVVFSHREPIELGKIRILERRGDDVALCACGYILPRALATIGIMATVVEVHALKPLDVDGIAGILKLTKAAVL